MLEIANMIILIILIIVLLLSLSLINKNLKKNDIKLNNNSKLNDNTINKKQFSMYVENDNGEYEEYNSSNLFPNGYRLNLEKSTCVDNSGKEVEGVLSSNGSKVTVTSNKTVFCYVYFDNLINLTDYLIENVSSSELWNSSLEDDGYRYVGTNPDNYICFGTSDKSTCTSDLDKYMYRIIGIFEDDNGEKHVKLIKKEALNTAYEWHQTYGVDVEWNESDLYKGLNGNYFLTNTSYVPNGWSNKISNWNYTMTNTKKYESSGPEYYYETGKNIYLHELNRNGKSSNIGEWKILSTKVSLMYASDYALSLGSPALNYTSSSNVSDLKKGWMYIDNSDSNPPKSDEWTMTRVGNDIRMVSYTNIVLKIASDGVIKEIIPDESYAMRPVFYLEEDVEFLGGTGTINDPFLIK